MKNFLGLALLVGIGAAGWRIGGLLSSDAVSMAVGVLFGVLAGVPTALLLIAGNRRQDESTNVADLRAHNRHAPAYASPPPVIIMATPHMAEPAISQRPHAPQTYNQGTTWGGGAPAPVQREFKVVGEQEEWLNEW
jgi:hypothetical protein